MIKTNRLPKEYQEVEYIESTGTQFIRTNYIPTQTTKIDLTFSIRSGALVYGMYPVLLGSQNDGGGVPCFNVFNDNGNTVNSRVGRNKVNNASSFITLSREIKHNIIVEFNNMILDNTSYSANTNVWGALTQPFSIFTRNSGTDIQEMEEKGLSSYVLYSLKFYEGTTLVKNYVPCYRKSDNVIGLYETIANEFFTNSGTGTFTKGADVGQTKIKKIMTKVNNTMKEVQYIKTKVNNNMVKVYDVLPSTYQRVEYLQGHPNSSASYYQGPVISFQAQPKDFDTIEMEFELTELHTNVDQQVLIGGRKTQSQGWASWSLRVMPNNEFTVYYGAEISTGVYPTVGTRYAVKVYAVNGTQKVYVDGVQVGTGSITFDMTTQNHTTLFSSYYGNYGDGFNCGAAAKMYKIRLYKNNVLVYHFVPCYRKSDGVNGMYELINGIFYTNIGTNGNFTKGGDV